MCDMGFEKDIRTIEAELPKQRQTLCYSATMTKKRPVNYGRVYGHSGNSLCGQTSYQRPYNIEQDVVHFENKRSQR